MTEYYDLDPLASPSPLELVGKWSGGRTDDERSVVTVDLEGTKRPFIINALRSYMDLEAVIGPDCAVNPDAIPDELEMSGWVDGVYARISMQPAEDDRPKSYTLDVD